MGRLELLLVATVIFLLLLAYTLRGSAGKRPNAPLTWGWQDLALYFAQGLGIGRIPVAPGTFGSLLGLLWFGLLLAPGRLWLFCAGTLAGIGLSVWLCGVGERMLGRKDPGSVVLDEIIAMPVCFAAWVGIVLCQTHTLPSFETFFTGRNWPLALGVFAAFRFFDVLKPWPVRQSQVLPGGWGITVDDVLAALYVNAVVMLVYGVVKLSN
jgi:phosphatidylglycerophosphatase A